MMNDISKIALVREMLDSAERSVREARKLLADMTGDVSVSSHGSTHARAKVLPKNYENTEEGRIIEGVFDGQNMVDQEGNTYPVPANYASKSKLIQGDQLKLTIDGSGRFIYKSIAPAKRKTLIGTLTSEDGQFKILSGGRAYRVLVASVTFHRPEVGDQVSILVPEEGEAEWAAIDALIPQEAEE